MRLATLSSLCVAGSFIHPPSPVQTIAFDSAPGFFAALYFGAVEGAVVTGLGHFITSIINGFPLGVLHLPIALGMALAGGVVGAVNQVHLRYGFIPATLAGVAVNTGLFAVAAPALGWYASLLLIPFLLTASSLNMGLAAAVYLGLRGRLRV
ncbi:MAG: hypothetical protein QXE22_06590 [Candidatus Bathyarchaeia archaeon]